MKKFKSLLRRDGKKSTKSRFKELSEQEIYEMLSKIRLTPEDKKMLEKMADASLKSLRRNTLRDNMVFHELTRRAIRFSVKTHEIYQKQKRKGKDIPYIVHPFTVGLILAKAGAPTGIIEAGILHDTIEDSIAGKKVTHELLREKFGPYVADIVKSVSEEDKTLPWKDRKRAALKHIETMPGPALWVETADVISNVSEIVDDYAKDGDAVFQRFNASKKEIIANYMAVINALIKRWTSPPHEKYWNPMMADLKTILDDLKNLAKNNQN